jgi:TctA family transporter
MISSKIKTGASRKRKSRMILVALIFNLFPEFVATVSKYIPSMIPKIMISILLFNKINGGQRPGLSAVLIFCVSSAR